MKISISTKHYENEQTPNLKGYATLKFDDKYILESVKVLEGTDANDQKKLFVALPSIKVDPDKNEGKEWKEFFHPITDKGRQGMTNAILKQFNNPDVKDNTFMSYDVGDKLSFEPTASAKNFNDYTKENLVGIGSVKFGKDFVCENIQVKTKKEVSAGEDGLYIDTPNRKVDPAKNDGKEYRAYFHPITAEAAAEFKNVCVNALNEFKAEKAKGYDWGEGVVEERTESKKAEKSETAETSIDGIDMSQFEDTSDFEPLDLTASNGLSR